MGMLLNIVLEMCILERGVAVESGRAFAAPVHRDVDGAWFRGPAAPGVRSGVAWAAPRQLARLRFVALCGASAWSSGGIEGTPTDKPRSIWRKIGIEATRQPPGKLTAARPARLADCAGCHCTKQQADVDREEHGRGRAWGGPLPSPLRTLVVRR